MTSAARKSAKPKSGVFVKRDASTGQLIVVGGRAGALPKPSIRSSALLKPMTAKVAAKVARKAGILTATGKLAGAYKR
jgi:hypothetical protein